MIDYSLYFITDERLNFNQVCHTVRAAIAGGATIIQYRNKEAEYRQMLREARMLHQITKELGVPLIINDNVKLALEIDAEGAHLGQEDLEGPETKNLITELKKRGKIFGVSVDENVEQAKQAIKDGVSYLGVGPVFPTSTKFDAKKPLSDIVIRQIIDAAKGRNIPCVAIGGIGPKNIRDVILRGFDGAAVISAISNAFDPEIAASLLCHIIKQARLELQMGKEIQGPITANPERR